MLSLLLSLSLSANLLGLKVSTGRSGVSLLLQETNTPLLSCVAHRSCLVILSPFSARLYSFISSLQPCEVAFSIAVQHAKPRGSGEKSGPGVI